MRIDFPSAEREREREILIIIWSAFGWELNGVAAFDYRFGVWCALGKANFAIVISIQINVTLPKTAIWRKGSTPEIELYHETPIKDVFRSLSAVCRCKTLYSAPFNWQFWPLSHYYRLIRFRLIASPSNFITFTLFRFTPNPPPHTANDIDAIV